jgi:hypothetical protein
LLSFLLPLVALLGVGTLTSQAFAQDRERFHPRNIPQQERHQGRDQFRQERPPNPERFNERREEMRSRAIERARQADTNHDGAISRQEADRSMPHLSRHFEEIDANHDGVVSREEMRAFRERRMQQRLERGGGDPRF